MADAAEGNDAGRIGALVRTALALTRSAWTCYWTRRAARDTIGVLRALDDRALKDIGLDRSEIESVATCCRYRQRGLGAQGPRAIKACS